ncbi:MAG TPA: protein kinase [Pyrinomonadaceae bacterium]|nr:protein kinase [Pyrinomonadaceae bacterium]
MSESLLPNSIISHYRIVSRIGAGGMGEVYLAQDTSELGRNVALKIVPAEVAQNKDRLQRFTQEARTVSNLNHPNILTVYEFGQSDTASFIATEYIDGVTLRQHLSSRRLKLIDVLDVTIQIVAALNAAHEAGITHRDLKPENVMVRKDHIVKVLDFGLAKLSEPAALAGGSDKSEASEDATKVFVQTEPGLVMGTVSYMSPEQSVGKGIDQRTDIWSIGVVLYEMLAGCVPFQGKDIHRQIIAIQETEPAPVSQLVEGVPDRLEEIVFKCLAKEKDERYQSAKDLLIDLRNLRRRLEVDAEIERTVAPGLRSTSGGTSRVSTQGLQSNAGATSAVQVPTASSAEYVVTGIKQHKLAAAIVVLVLVAGGIGLGIFMRARNTEGAIDSVAVLPFENKSNAADTDYLSDGLAESLIYRLSQLPNLKVSPTSSVMRYKGKEADVKTIAGELGVSAVMTGRIAQRGDNLTISVELVDTRNNKLLWGEQYERKISELLTTQREIAAEIANKLQLKLSGEGEQKLAKKYTDSNEAYQLYLKGLFHFANRTKEDVQKAIGYFQQATRLDPNFALAYVGISQSYSLMPSYSYLSPKDAFPQAKAAAQKALEIDPLLADAHAALATTFAAYEWNWVEAEREFKQAIELNPNVADIHYRYGLIYLIPAGRMDEAIREIKRALELEPLSIAMNANLAGAYMYARQNDLALAQARKTFDLEPGHITARVWLTNVYESLGMYSEAIALSEESTKNHTSDQYFLFYAGYAYAKTGRRDKAEDAIKKLRDLEKTEPVDPYLLATLYVGLGDKDKALVELEKSFNERGYYVPLLRVDPLMDPLRDDPRFADLIERIGLPK